MFQNCISASKKCNSCWVRLRGSAGWCTIFCCTILHTRLALDCTCCAIAIARTRIATNCTGCKITRLQTADLHTIAPDYCMQGCLQLVRHCCSRTSPTLPKLCSTIFTAHRKMRHWSTVLNKMWDKELWKGALKLHKSSSALQKCTLGTFANL